MSETNSDKPTDELRLRVIYSLFLPVVRLSHWLGIPMKELVRWTQVAYYHELKRGGMTMREMSGHLDLSMRKIALLSRDLKANFFQPEQAHDLPRRIEFMLWAAPLSRARIKQALPTVAQDELDLALETLLDAGRAELDDGRTPQYRLVKSATRLGTSAILSRIGGLNSLMGNLANAVFARFFQPATESFARTLAFRVRPTAIQRLRELYEQQIWPVLKSVDEEAESSNDAEAFSFSVFWAPFELEPDDETKT